MNIATRLKSIRKSFGFTLSEVSEKTGIGLSSLSELEHGKREPMLSHLKKLSEVYEKSISYFLETAEIKEHVLLWRNKPEAPKCNQLEARFIKLCKQYKNLETWTKTPHMNSFEKLFTDTYPKDYNDVRKLAYEIWKEMELGSRPGESLFRILEEIYAVKIFNLDLGSEGFSACIYTEEYGPGIMLDQKSKQWRRNFDLAHELFHLITWKVRVEISGDAPLIEKEEQFANYFASVLLMPEEQIKEAIASFSTKKSGITYADLDSIARQFGVSLEALFWRIRYIYKTPADKTKKWIEESKFYAQLPLRKSETSDNLPERYKNMAVVALREGLISSKQFANYLGIGISDIYTYQISGKSDVIKINTGAF